MNSTDSILAEDGNVDVETPAGLSPAKPKYRRWLIGSAMAAAVVAAAVIVPWQLQEAAHRGAWATYQDAVSAHDAAVDGYVDGAAALTARYELAGEQLVTFQKIISSTPDAAVTPAEAKPDFVAAVNDFEAVAIVPTAEGEDAEPASEIAPLDTEHAKKLQQDATTERIESETTTVRRATPQYDDAMNEDAGTLEAIDGAYDEAISKLDAMMAAGSAWGNRDVYAKDTAEQGAALVAAAQALVKPDGEAFEGLDDRAAAIQAFVDAQAAAAAGHAKTVAAEEEAARQAAAAEAERQAVAQRQAQRQQNNSTPNTGSHQNNASRNNSGGGSPSTPSVPQGGGRPGGGTNETNGDCWTSNGTGGRKPC
ncbi:hypothetical protein ACFC14_18580 [Microbacterium sp. NPDC055988]|uniref:hypothetical protein n=1 Tax=Microbacterium sp. NPDC055988 TaxID=3345671 RepID=UPI0035DA2AD2